MSGPYRRLPEPVGWKSTSTRSPSSDGRVSSPLIVEDLDVVEQRHLGLAFIDALHQVTGDVLAERPERALGDLLPQCYPS